MYLVQSGAVDLYRVIGGQEEILATMEKGDFFGEDSLLDGSPRSTHARVREDAEVIIINGTIFDKMLKGNIEIAFRMMRKMAAKVRQANQMIEQLKLQGASAGGLGQPTVERRAYVEAHGLRTTLRQSSALSRNASFNCGTSAMCAAMRSSIWL